MVVAHGWLMLASLVSATCLEQLELAEELSERARRIARPEPPDFERDQLRQAAVSADRAPRAVSTPGSPAVSEVWLGLAWGRWRLIDRFDGDGRHYLIARKNAHELRPRNALTPREEQVARGAALGHSNKFLGYELGTSASRISDCIKRARAKLGVRSRSELFQLACCPSSSELHLQLKNAKYLSLSYALAELAALSTLSESERAIFRAILHDLSNADIAALRRRSSCTVANQVASLFKKLGVNSRAELVAKQASEVGLRPSVLQA